MRRRKPDQPVTAPLALDFDGFNYRKWGDTQRAQPGDWLVDNAGDVDTVAADVFVRTYREVSPGRWVKSTPVWAEQAAYAGSVVTGRPHALPSRRLAGLQRRGRQRRLCHQRREIYRAL
jgi:hypothetical protein